MTNEQNIAGEIFKQLGGNRFKSMVGACNLICGTGKDGNTYAGLKFKGSKVANHLRVTLLPTDTYKVEFIKVWGTKIKPVATHENVYCDQLQSLFTDVTGLYTTL